ncbi:MAG: Gamma-glutamylputrescine synthetase PuuA [Alphaproteobacteria bacterium MarineAlpha5_Bin5]|nr:MAG: Gamma-glutamylputrescine synthetase PuuA [Alphaproteobacteria bacterium MarineAlpha5_Bin5]PPR52380.1 MAG: Gamma-glutamylputrescine synthetase PuuA [Alphaproteobacteria bacterium MarineAlpha5_Bin4]|tara:strand:+ start:9660 stop:11024 length:1365 start_codon:yes stop_codon:yes gene_type:complete
MVDNFKTWLEENSITEVECLVPDLGGIARGKILPTNKFISGLLNDSHRLPQSVFIQTISGGYATEDEELPIDVYNPTDIDVILRPDYNTIRNVPWYDDPTAQVICDAVNLNGTHVINSSRTVLKKILKLFDELGYEPIISPEVEFYLVKPNPDSDYPLEVPIGQSGREETGKQAFGIDAVNEFDNLFEDVYNYCEQQNIEIDTINHESGSAQMEINFQHGEPLELADQVFLFKRTLRQAAIKHKLYATFMAKPMENQPGSSLHLHQSLFNKKNNKNVFYSKKNTISNLMKSYIAGLQAFTPKLMPIHAPNINSYRRLFATWDAPRNTNWGIGNRSCGFRIPSHEEESMRIENRISGSDTNPYLVIAANLAAGYLGIKNKMKPTTETKKSVFGQQKSSLPKNMEEAISLFEKDDQINDVFNQKFVRTIAAIRRVENQAYLKVISSWEREFLLLNV